MDVKQHGIYITLYVYIYYIYLKCNKKYNLMTCNNTLCICEKYMTISTIVLEQCMLLQL